MAIGMDVVPTLKTVEEWYDAGNNVPEANSSGHGSENPECKIPIEKR